MGVVLQAVFGSKEDAWWRLATRATREVVDGETGEIVDLTPGQDDPDDIQGLLIDFRYVSAEGAMTRRSILCWQCWRDGERLYVRGYCPFREDFRTFRVDRMRDVIETRSGRAIAADDLDAYFGAFARENVAHYPGTDADPVLQVRMEWQPPTAEEIEAQALRQHIRHRARRHCIAGLRILAYIALADDVRSEAERNIEQSYIESRLAMGGFGFDADLSAALLDIARALAVPPGSFTAAIREVVKDKAYFDLVLASAQLLGDLDGGQGQAESKAIGRLRAAGEKAGLIGG